MTKMDDAKYTDLIAKYLSGNIAPDEKEVLFAWMQAAEGNRLFFDEMIQLWSLSASYPTTENTDTTAAWAKLEVRLFGGGTTVPTTDLNQGRSAKIVRLSIKRATLSAAAIILLTISASIWWWGDSIFGDPTITYKTFAQEQKEFRLPDGSTVWLNENSQLQFDKKFTQRIVQLQGEAFFDVAHLDSNFFKIQSGDAETTVFGTSFNVRAYPTEDRIEVSVKTGVVALRKKQNTKASLVLKAGESGVLYKKTNALQVDKISNPDAWKTQLLEFGENATLGEVIEALERYFDIRVEAAHPSILNCPYTANKTYKNPQLTEIIQIFKFGFDLELEKKDSVYVLQGPGCSNG